MLISNTFLNICNNKVILFIESSITHILYTRYTQITFYTQGTHNTFKSRFPRDFFLMFFFAHVAEIFSLARASHSSAARSRIFSTPLRGVEPTHPRTPSLAISLPKGRRWRAPRPKPRHHHPANRHSLFRKKLGKNYRETSCRFPNPSRADSIRRSYLPLANLP